MILIFTENVSYSARYVARHLYHMKQAFELFLEHDKIDFSYEIGSSREQISVFKNGQFLCAYDEIRSVWAHRSEITLDEYYSNLDEKEHNYVLGHQITQRNAIKHMLLKKKCLGRFGKLNFNKLIFLDACKHLKINIPETLITRKKSELITFYREQKNGIIVKSLASNFHYCVSISEEEQIWQYGITNSIDETKLDQLPEAFDLSLFQEKLDKKYELRVLFVAGICFPQIIFSQNHAYSEVDYRQGLGDSDMRQCNVLLPQKITNQINQLMDFLDLNIGCIDIVVTKQNEYVFLEVNPSGIFTDMMDNCNYDMHYEIAKFLTS